MKSKLNLIKNRNDIYANSPSVFWIMSIFGVAALLAIMALDLLVSGMYIFTVPLVFVPILFACFVTCFSIKFGGTVTIGGFFKISGKYYKSPNFGCFRLITNFLKSFLAQIILIIILVIILNNVYIAIYGQEYVDMMQTYINVIYAQDETEFTSLLSKDSLFLQFFNTVSSMSFSVALIVFVFGVLYSSINIYFRFNLPNAGSPIANMIFKEFIKTNRNEYRKDFWYLNWPAFTLLLIGIGTGYAIIFASSLDLGYAQVLTSMIGFVFVLPFMPFVFANMEALANKYQNKFIEAGNKLTKEALEELKNRTDLTEEQKQKISEMIEEGNKKDSDSSEP